MQWFPQSGVFGTPWWAPQKTSQKLAARKRPDVSGGVSVRHPMWPVRTNQPSFRKSHSRNLTKTLGWSQWVKIEDQIDTFTGVWTVKTSADFWQESSTSSLKPGYKWRGGWYINLLCCWCCSWHCDALLRHSLGHTTNFKHCLDFA